MCMCICAYMCVHVCVPIRMHMCACVCGHHRMRGTCCPSVIINQQKATTYPVNGSQNLHHTDSYKAAELHWKKATTIIHKKDSQSKVVCMKIMNGVTTNGSNIFTSESEPRLTSLKSVFFSCHRFLYHTTQLPQKNQHKGKNTTKSPFCS